MKQQKWSVVFIELLVVAAGLVHRCWGEERTPGQGLSGVWYDPAHDGEGFVLQILEDGRALVFWFSYGPDGARRWFYGIGALQDGEWVFEDMLTTAGRVFGNGFDPETVERAPWGSLAFDIDCDGGEAAHESTEEDFGAGALQLKRLTVLDRGALTAIERSLEKVFADAAQAAISDREKLKILKVDIQTMLDAGFPYPAYLLEEVGELPEAY